MSDQLPPSTPPDLTVHQRIILRAAELISVEENWIKGKAFRAKSGDLYGNYCSLGALYKAAGEVCGVITSEVGNSSQALMAYTNAVSWFSRLVPEHYRDYYSGSYKERPIHTWNDASTTKYSDVKQAFCKAAK